VGSSPRGAFARGPGADPRVVHALASHTRALRIVPAALGDRAGVTGAGLAAWEMVSRA
jgi:hypothetical protein